MNKTELIALLEARMGSHGAAVAALDSVLAEIQHAVAAGERVVLTGFGTFERVERPARTGRNPRTGAALEIAASASPRFHAGAVLRAAVAGTTPAPRTTARPPSSGTRVAAPKGAAITLVAPVNADRKADGKAVKPAKPSKKAKVQHVKPGKKSSSGKGSKGSKSAGSKRKKK